MAAKPDTGDKKLSKRELLFAAAAAVLLIVVIASASVRQSVLCDSGQEAETEAHATLARQALEARLLNVEQEAMENQILVNRVVGLLDAKFGSTDRAVGADSDNERSFAELYADAEKLAVEIDAAFLAADDDQFKPKQKAADDWRSWSAEGDIELKSKADDWSPKDDWKAAELDDFKAARERSHLDDLGSRADPADREACEGLRGDFAIVPGISWGTAPLDAQTEWRTRRCDELSKDT